MTLTDTNIRVVGLLTREYFDDLPSGFGRKDDVVVYVPYSYQIGGFTIVVPRERIQPIDMPLEDAMRFIVTAGAKGRTGESKPPAKVSDGGSATST